MNDYLIQADDQSQKIRNILLHEDRLNRDYIQKEIGYANYMFLNEWYNGREQGYVLNICSHDYKYQLHIAFYEHRNSDSVHLIVWNQNTFNPVCTIDSADLSGLAFQENKWDTSHSFGPGNENEVAEFIIKIAFEFMRDSQSFVELLYAEKGILY